MSTVQNEKILVGTGKAIGKRFYFFSDGSHITELLNVAPTPLNIRADHRFDGTSYRTVPHLQQGILQANHPAVNPMSNDGLNPPIITPQVPVAQPQFVPIQVAQQQQQVQQPLPLAPAPEVSGENKME